MRDLYFRSAVERQFEIVGEAMRRLEALDTEFAARITHHRQIIDFRNFLAHGYDEIDDIAVWHTITVDLPRLIAEAEALLAELDEGAQRHARRPGCRRRPVGSGSHAYARGSGLGMNGGGEVNTTPREGKLSPQFVIPP